MEHNHNHHHEQPASLKNPIFARVINGGISGWLPAPCWSPSSAGALSILSSCWRPASSLPAKSKRSSDRRSIRFWTPCRRESISSMSGTSCWRSPPWQRSTISISLF